jgi:hypothetical protein
VQVKSVAARLFLATSSCALATGAQGSETTTFTYDALGRLVATSSSGTVNNGLTTGIGYDRAGNRACYTVTGAATGSGGGCTPSPPPPPPPPPPPSPPPPPPPPPPSGTPPVTVADSASVGVCNSVTVDVVANDSDPGGNYPLTLVSVGSSSRGEGTVASTTQVTFTAYGTIGNTSVQYVVRNSVGTTATGTLNIAVTNGSGCQ